MKMRTYLGNRRQAIHKFLRNNPGLQRPQPDPLNPVHLSNFTHQIQQISPLHSRPAQILSIFQIITIRLINKIHTIGTDMNTRKHNLLIPLPGKPPDLLQDILLLHVPVFHQQLSATLHLLDDLIQRVRHPFGPGGVLPDEAQPVQLLQLTTTAVDDIRAGHAVEDVGL